MPPKGRQAKRGSAKSRGRGALRSKNEDLRQPEHGSSMSVYREMMAEAGLSLTTPATARPLKRRKKAGDAQHEPEHDVIESNVEKYDSESAEEEAAFAETASDSASETELGALGDQRASAEASNASAADEDVQIVYDDSESSEDSDDEFQRLVLQGIKDDAAEPETSEENPPVEVSVPVSRDLRDSDKRPRRQAKAKDKAQRIDIHKVSLLCWLMHGHLRNIWCNDATVQTILRELLTLKQISFLNPDANLPQNEQSLLFQRGIEEATKLFREEFRVTRTTAASRTEFVTAAKKLQGSTHTGNQLFCSLLRAAGVQARLVCSLQVTKLNSILPISETSHEINEPSAPIIVHRPALIKAEENPETEHHGGPQRIKRRLGRRSPSVVPRQVTTGTPSRIERQPESFPSSPYPIYWIEAFSVPNQRWLCIDPLVTKSWNKPRKLEPPLYDEGNTMNYVLGYDNDLSARDVTRRYAKAYSAKTFRRRIESVPDGEKWLRRVMKLFRRPHAEDADQIEDAEFARLTAAEPMPNAQQDFKDHPFYALERHLHHNEVIHPKREVGKVVIGKKQEPIYRRRDLHIVRSSDKWYRAFGRQIRRDEQPLKYGKSRRRGRLSVDDDATEDDEVGVGLYAEHQTQLYVPHPVIDGKIQKNIYGNLDVYVPSMIPAGGAHVRSSDALAAARIARVDFAEAITGFQFKGRRGTAIARGIIVAKEHYQAIEAICHGLREAREDAAQAKESAETLKLWKRFLLGLRIRERVMAEADLSEKTEDVQQKIFDAEHEEEEMAGEGGFFLENDPQPQAPTGNRGRPSASMTAAPLEVDEAVEAVNEDDELPSWRRGQRIRRNYFEPTLFSMWQVPAEQSKPTSPLPSNERAQPGLVSEQTNDSLFQDDASAGGSNGDGGDQGGFMVDNDVESGGFIRDEQMSEAEELRQESPLEETAVPGLDGAAGNEPHDEQAQRDREDTSMSALPETSPNRLSQDNEQDVREGAGSPSSLLSHDPEDDLMEEDWLVDETGL